MAFGVGTAGTPPSETTVYEKVRGLEAKGCLKIIGSERAGTRLQIVLPAEIAGVIPPPVFETEEDLEQQDFFSVPENRKRILERESWRCFYCLVRLDENNHVIEHVQSRPEGANSYRNVVAACRRCNNCNGANLVDDFLRSLYRDGILSGDDLQSRIALVGRLRTGGLRPVT